MATDNIDELSEWMTPIIRNLAPGERKKLNGKLSRGLRKEQKLRIKEQVNPDGTPFVPRKKNPPPGSSRTRKTGKIKRRAMFSKIGTAKYMKSVATPDLASVRITGRAGRIARVHQYGLVDRVEKHGPRYDYPKRELLGFSERDTERLAETVLEHIAPD